MEIETDKTVAEFPALADGVLVEWLASEGDRLEVGAPLARVEIDPRDRAALLNERAEEPVAPEAARHPTVRAKVAAGARGRLRATPAARRLARNRGVRLADVPGTGRRGSR